MNTSSSHTIPDLTDIFAYVDTHRQEFLDRLIDYVRRPSISAHGQGIGEVAAYIADVMQRMGMQTRILPTAGWPMVLGERLDVPGGPTVLLYGHYDVQPPEPLDAWISPPFEPTIRNGRLYARGVGDNKGQHFAQLLALETLLACRGALPCNVRFLLEGEEEVGSPHMPEFVREHRAEVMANLVITSDGPVHESGRSQILFGVRGILSFELRAKGAKAVLPHEAFAKCDIRLVEAQSADEIFAKVVAHVRLHAPGVEVIHQGSMEPSKTPLDSPFTEPLRRAIEAAQGIEPLLVPAMGGSLPDYVFTKTLGIPAFVVPYANADEANHAPNENLEVERFFMGIKTGAAMLAYIAAI